MIEYKLKDADGNEYSLNGTLVTAPLSQSWTQDADAFEYESKVIERSYLAGAALVGEPRVTARNLSLMVDSTNQDSGDYRTHMNELLEAIFHTRWIEDVTNGMEIQVVPEGTNIAYEAGALKLMSKNTFNFKTLTPHWRSTTLTEVTGTVLADTLTAIPITVAGYAEVSPIITLETTAAVVSSQLTVNSTDHGIELSDALFGTTGNLEMIIDCEAGTVKIGDINRNTSIVDGTGFFQIPSGAQAINALFADEDVDYTIAYRSLSWL